MSYKSYSFFQYIYEFSTNLNVLVFFFFCKSIRKRIQWKDLLQKVSAKKIFKILSGILNKNT